MSFENNGVKVSSKRLTGVMKDQNEISDFENDLTCKKCPVSNSVFKVYSKMTFSFFAFPFVFLLVIHIKIELAAASHMDNNNNNNNNNGSWLSSGDGEPYNPRDLFSIGQSIERRREGYEQWAESILLNPISTNFSSGAKKTQKMGRSRGGRNVCKISEFPCSRGKCISADKFCDGTDHCGDSSDEPVFCTPCNRTYYGEWGRTYSLTLNSATVAAALGLTHQQQLQGVGGQPQGGILGSHQGKKAPIYSPHFVCQLTFAAAGDNFGDLVQIMFDSINIGHFASSTHEGCPQGSLQVAEISRPITGGKWCGSGQGYSVYFSEMSAIALTLSLGPNGSPRQFINSSLPSSGIRPGPEPHPSSNSEFDFKIRYKFIPRSLATVRFGSHGSPVERGEVVPGSYCSRDFEACHRRRCKIQSPNYPGLYPRNVTCQFTIRHREKQPCKHVLIQVSQPKAHKVQLKAPAQGTRQIILPPYSSSSSGGQGSGGTSSSSQHQQQQQQSLLIQEDAVVAWDECGDIRDTLTIYDGTSMDDPILLVMCGGGRVPPITSSGPELLVVFRATPFGNPLEPKPSPPFPLPLRGFEIDVDVIMVDSESADYSNRKENCTFIFVSEPSDKCLLFKPQEKGGNWISGKRGKVTNPRHTIPPNTTCRYEFKGHKHEAVWVYFVSYSRPALKEMKPGERNCSSRLRIRDGLDSRNEALLGSFCDWELPKLCDHKGLQNESRALRACTENESYISAGSTLIIEQAFLHGTALGGIHYQFHYEFVARHPSTDGTCHRHFETSKMKPKGNIRTSENVFDFGRGGRSNLTCTYTFTLAPYEALRITFRNSSFGDRPCRTVTDMETGRYVCNYIAHTTTPSTPLGQNETGANGGTHESHTHSVNPVVFPPRSELSIVEYIWPSSTNNITSHGHCICSNSSGSLAALTFLGRKVTLTFTVEQMNSKDSQDNFFVNFDYEVLKDEGCRADNHYMKSESGLISLESTFSHGGRTPSCEHYPWLLEAKQNHSLYLRIPGFPMMEHKKRPSYHHHGLGNNHHLGGMQPKSANYIHTNPNNPNFNVSRESEVGSGGDNATVAMSASGSGSAIMLPGLAKFQIDKICPTTKNRILIYDRNNKLVQKICPASISNMNKKSHAQTIEIYSEDFDEFHSPLFPPPKSRFLIEFIGKELGSYQIKWLELISAKMKTTLKAMEYDPSSGAKTTSKSNNLSAFPDLEEDEVIRRGTPPWDETLNKMFEGQNGEQIGSTDSLHITPGEGSPLGSPICSSYCPELRACISEKLWCDGEVHCPDTGVDEKSCDTFWATLNQLMSPAVYIPLLAAVASALCCCVLVTLCVAVKRMIINMRSKGQLGIGSVTSSRTSTVDRRIPSRDYFYDPHEPIS